MVLYIMFCLLFCMAIIFWLFFLVGYPIYKKIIKREHFDWIWYAFWLNILSLIVNVIGTIIKCYSMMGI